MNCIVPFEKNIDFKTNIAEITSISLEHEITVNEKSLLGNFIISGEYKSHEVSVNTEKFNYTLPFDVTFPDNLDGSSVNFNVEDFTYEIKKPNTLNIKIEFSVVGEEIKKEIVEEPIVEEQPSEELKQEEQRAVEDVVEVENNQDEPLRENNVLEENKNNIIDMATTSSDNYITYHIHMVKETDSLETIVKTYGVSESDLAEYNNIKNLTVGDKLIIPADE